MSWWFRGRVWGAESVCPSCLEGVLMSHCHICWWRWWWGEGGWWGGEVAHIRRMYTEGQMPLRSGGLPRRSLQASTWTQDPGEAIDPPQFECDLDRIELLSRLRALNPPPQFECDLDRIELLSRLRALNCCAEYAKLVPRRVLHRPEQAQLQAHDMPIASCMSNRPPRHV